MKRKYLLRAGLGQRAVADFERRTGRTRATNEIEDLLVRLNLVKMPEGLCE